MAAAKKKPAANKPAVKTPAAKKPAKSKKGGNGTPDNPWQLTTPPGSSAFIAYKDGDSLVCKVGSTTLAYQARCIDALHAMLKAHGDWLPLGGADENKPAAPGTVEAWGRDASNPVGGWYGTK